MRSDHQLLMVTFAIKLRKTKIKEDRVRRIDVAELKVAQTKAGFQLEFRNRFQALEEESVEPELSSFHQKVRVAGEKILRLKKRKKEHGTSDKILERWQEYFHSIFNRPEPNKTAAIRADTQYYHIHTDRPSIQEINNTISEWKNGKAPGAGGISADLLQAEKFVTFTILSSFSAKSGRLV